MSDVALQDLKQYFKTALTQQSVGFHAQFGQLRIEMKDLEAKIDDLSAVLETKFAAVDQRFEDLSTVMETKFAAVDERFEDLSEAVAEAIEISNDANGGQLVDHERRITRLEQKAT